MLLAVGLSAAYGQNGASEPAAPAAQPPALAIDPATDFLAQVQDAANALDYAGITVYQAGSEVQAARLLHWVDGSGQGELYQSLDGQANECLKHNGTETCLYPQRQLVVVTKNADASHFPNLLLEPDRQLSPNYDWRPMLGKYRIAGRECNIAEIVARDDLRYSYRLCTDVENQLLLKIQSLDQDLHVIDQVAFSHLRLGGEFNPRELEPSYDTQGWYVLEQDRQAIDLEALGWRLVLPRGFEISGQFRRPLGHNHQVDQAVLSDGLASISIFIETFDPNRDQSIQEGSLRKGAVNIYRVRLASFWITAVGEVPAQTVQNLVQNIQYVPGAAQ